MERISGGRRWKSAKGKGLEVRQWSRGVGIEWGGRNLFIENKGLYSRGRWAMPTKMPAVASIPQEFTPFPKCPLSLVGVTPTMMHDVYPSPSLLILQPNRNIT